MYRRCAGSERRARSPGDRRHRRRDGHRELGSRRARTVSYEEWATTRLQLYYRHLEDLIWPDLFVVGGGVSRKAHKFLPLLDLRTPIVPAVLENAAGIIGAALLAQQTQETRGKHKA